LHIGGAEHFRLDQQFAQRLLEQMKLGDRIVVFDGRMRVRVIVVIVIAVIVIVVVIVIVIMVMVVTG
jgi:hypothetical protein